MKPSYILFIIGLIIVALGVLLFYTTKFVYLVKILLPIGLALESFALLLFFRNKIKQQNGSKKTQ